MVGVMGGPETMYSSFLKTFIPGFLFGTAVIGTLIVLATIFLLAFYIYTALVLSTIAKKLKYKNYWLAWIPIANLALYPILAKKHWAWVFIFLVPVANFVFYFIWSWNIFEQRKYPGWLSLFLIGVIIPAIGWLFNLANLVIWGIVAWQDK